jgi:hypothetical protein
MKSFWIRCAALVVLFTSAAQGELSTPSTIFRQGAGGVPDTAEASDRFGAALASGNFNGDAYLDLAIGVVWENSTAGAVQILYGTSSGLSSFGQQYFNQTTLSQTGGDQLSESGDQFGGALAAGDFNGDGFDDLAIGAPGEKLGAVVVAGAMSVVYGSETGLDLTSGEFWNQDSSGIEGAAGTNESFGAALAAGRFDNDIYADLAVGVPGQVTGGAVHVLYGSGSGISTSGDTMFRQGSTGGGYIGLEGTGGTVGAEARLNERFGYSLAVGQFDGDDYDDLAIGVPWDEHSSGISWIISGGIHIVFGSSAGLNASSNLYFDQSSPGVPGVWEAGNEFGSSLAVGRFNSDLYDDLAVGSPGENSPVGDNAGMVAVLFGSATKSLVGTTGTQQLIQGSGGLLDVREQSDKFGKKVIAGRYPEESGELDYLGIAATSESVTPINLAGAMNIVYATPTGLLNAEANQFFNQNVSDFGDSCELSDQFGLAAATGDFNGDGSPDLAIGVPEEDLGTGNSITNAGIVQILYFPGPPALFEDDFEAGNTAAWSLTQP